MANSDWLTQEYLLIVGRELLDGRSSAEIADVLNESLGYTSESPDFITRSAACGAVNRQSTWDALALHFTDVQIETMRRLRRVKRVEGGIPPPPRRDNVLIFGENPRPFGAYAPPGPTDLPEETPGGETVVSISAFQCKWPIGTPGTDGFTFCGRRTPRGPYCIEHAQVAYQQPTKRKKKPKAVIDDLPVFSRYN